MIASPAIAGEGLQGRRLSRVGAECDDREASMLKSVKEQYDMVVAAIAWWPIER